MIDIIKASLWNTKEIPAADETAFEDMKMHAVVMLSAPVLPRLSIDSGLKESWKRCIIHGTMHNNRCNVVQSNLPITVPYVILKGTSAAKYYPYPEFRLLGDIDIMTRREDFDAACNMLRQSGYKEESSHDETGIDRHRCFVYGGVAVEVHSFFAMLNDPEKAEYLDNLIISNISPTHVLPDYINGLVILEHINQHLEEGLGLRQILDWMMFVDKQLPDSGWETFCPYAQNIGLDKLAITVTRMCEMYLGLPERQWSSSADETLCRQLMDYILSCGNFGNKRKSDSDIGEKVFMRIRSLRSFFRLLQERGLSNWKAAKAHSWLRPFAWIYQIGRYCLKGLGREKASAKLKEEYISAKKRSNMFDELGVKQMSKDIAVLQDGKFIKK